jgi:hypothetical protein
MVLALYDLQVEINKESNTLLDVRLLREMGKALLGAFLAVEMTLKGLLPSFD